MYVFDDHLVREQLARNYAFFGDGAMARVRRARVVVVGCGGVGSWAAVMLVRSCVAAYLLCAVTCADAHLLEQGRVAHPAGGL